jgi:hypothetical protein
VRRWSPGKLLHHSDSAAIRTDPGWTIADSPFVFFKTFRADLEAARTVPAKWQFSTAAMAFKILCPAPPSGI